MNSGGLAPKSMVSKGSFPGPDQGPPRLHTHRLSLAGSWLLPVHLPFSGTGGCTHTATPGFPPGLFLLLVNWSPRANWASVSRVSLMDLCSYFFCRMRIFLSTSPGSCGCQMDEGTLCQALSSVECEALLAGFMCQLTQSSQLCGQG